MIEAFPLGAWVIQGDKGLVANHLPFLLDRSRGKLGTLLGHVARANPVWRDLSEPKSSIVLFQGPQAYITPGWYPGKQQHGKVVPTWDYAVAHAYGVARAVHDEVWLRDLLMRLTHKNEALQSVPWKMTDAPAEYIERLLDAVVGIEIPIDQFVGKIKASQDEDLQDRLGTVKGLLNLGTENSTALASLVENALDDECKGSAG